MKIIQKLYWIYKLEIIEKMNLRLVISIDFKLFFNAR